MPRVYVEDTGQDSPGNGLVLLGRWPIFLWHWGNDTLAPTPDVGLVASSYWFRVRFRYFLYARLKNGTYYAVAMSVRPSVRLSVCPSVRPSVRPRFPDFSSTCFEISIWNLVYAFSRWHDMSSLSCITIGSIWPSLQPKVGQTYFLQSWPHKSR